jgi:hypothetical protein
MNLGKMRNAYKNLVRKIQKKKPRGRSRRRWEDDIKMDIREEGGKVMTSLDSQDSPLGFFFGNWEFLYPAEELFFM